MVTRILFDPRRDLTDGTTTSSPVIVSATPTGIQVNGAIVVYPGTITFVVNTGADPINLPPNLASTGWRLVARQDGIIRQERTVRVPDIPSITWQDLPDIDPASLTVTPGTAKQWDATFWALAQLIGGSPQPTPGAIVGSTLVGTATITA